jgi:hypothetical protein
MRILFSLLIFLSSFSSFAMTRTQLEAILKEKGINLAEVEIKGMKVLMGEVTGHINAVPFSKVQILVTNKEAILKREIDSVDFKSGQTLGDVISVRYSGQYILKKDVKATLVLGQ